jgi:uncharacterized protein (DUF1697 family)
MSKYVAFLRGINVGGNKIIKMETLREVFESMGFSEVKTYIASGNVIFETRSKTATTLKSKIESALKKALGHEVTVALLSFEDLAVVSQEDVFDGIEAGKDVGLFVAFLVAQPTLSPKLPISVPKDNFDVLGARDRAVFIVVRRNEKGQAAFPNDFVEKQFGVKATTRNWNTVKKIVESQKKAPKAGK